MSSKKVLFILFAAMAILVGLYPFLILLSGTDFELRSEKDLAILGSVFWNITFYIHITLGGIALLIGWIQFNKKLRSIKIKVHRMIG